MLVLGPGGTGKSYLIRRVVEQLREQGKTVAVTALTGLAAFHIGGTTLHSFAGIGLGDGTLDSLVKRVRMRTASRRNWTDTDVLVIDEVSMLSKELFEVLDGVARILRRCPDEPWGGLQVLGSGDFCQLPPVRAQYCFDSERFSELFAPNACVLLETNFRQGTDEVLQRILAEVRQGQLSPLSIAVLTACTTKVVPASLDIDPVYIAATRRQVDAENDTRMSKLAGPEHRCTCAKIRCPASPPSERVCECASVRVCVCVLDSDDSRALPQLPRLPIALTQSNPIHDPFFARCVTCSVCIYIGSSTRLYRRAACRPPRQKSCTHRCSAACRAPTSWC